MSRTYPRVQVIWWRAWKGVGWHRWPGKLDAIFRGSLCLGFVELRFWR